MTVAGGLKRGGARNLNTMGIQKVKILQAARAQDIPECTLGLWIILKKKYDRALMTKRHRKNVILPSGIYTHLIRMTKEKMHLWPPGEVVMEDTPFELKTHLNFMLKAYGDVLVTGLGLGCVCRGLLANPKVKSVTCIERDENILGMVKPFMPQERLQIIKADAIEWCKETSHKFDFAWHDLWTDREKGEPKLVDVHSQVIGNCFKKVRHQGAWNFPKILKRRFSLL